MQHKPGKIELVGGGERQKNQIPQRIVSLVTGRIKVKEEDVSYFSKFLKEFQDETDRGAALVGAALIDSRLDRILSSHLIECKEAKELIEGGNACLSTLSAKSKLCYCLGLITSLEFCEIETIRKIRNEFAHQVHGLDFHNQRVRDLCNNLKANTPDNSRFGGNPRQLFINSIILTSLSLWYRPEYAKHIKAEERRWEYELS